MHAAHLPEPLSLLFSVPGGVLGVLVLEDLCQVVVVRDRAQQVVDPTVQYAACTGHTVEYSGTQLEVVQWIIRRQH